MTVFFFSCTYCKSLPNLNFVENETVLPFSKTAVAAATNTTLLDFNLLTLVCISVHVYVYNNNNNNSSVIIIINATQNQSMSLPTSNSSSSLPHYSSHSTIPTYATNTPHHNNNFTSNTNHYEHTNRRRAFLHDVQLPSVPRMRATILLSAIEEFRNAQRELLEAELMHVPVLDDEAEPHHHSNGSYNINSGARSTTDAKQEADNEYNDFANQADEERHLSRLDNTHQHTNDHHKSKGRYSHNGSYSRVWDQFKRKEDDINNILHHLDIVCTHMDTINRQQQHRTDLHAQQQAHSNIYSSGNNSQSI